MADRLIKPAKAMEQYGLSESEISELMLDNGCISEKAAAAYSKHESSKDLQLYSVTEAANLLGCSYRHMRYLVSNGQIEAAKLGERWKISYKALARFIDGLETNK